LAQRAAASVREEILPITDVRSTEEYRLEVAARIAARFVRRLGGLS
jgi:CO/xanthine dehydrogenase FAD-binding subunit